MCARGVAPPAARRRQRPRAADHARAAVGVMLAPAEPAEVAHLAAAGPPGSLRMRALPPAHSPLSLPALAAGGAAALGAGADPRPLLRDILRRAYAAREVVLCDSGTSALRLAIEVARTIG